MRGLVDSGPCSDGPNRSGIAASVREGPCPTPGHRSADHAPAQRASSLLGVNRSRARFAVIPLLAVLAPLAGAVAIAVSGDRPRLRALWTGLASVSRSGWWRRCTRRCSTARSRRFASARSSPGVDVVLRVDAAGMVFAATAAALWILASSYSIGYVNGADEHHRTRFFATFAVCVSTTVGLAFAGNLFTFFVFYELLTLATYPLVVHKQTPRRSRPGSGTCSRSSGAGPHCSWPS
jgi:hypothetical protein